MLVVGLFAIVGAGVVYYQWRQLGSEPVTPTLSAEGPSARPRPPPPVVTQVRTASDVVPQPSAVDAGSPRDAGTDAGDAGAAYEPPPGMIHVTRDAGSAVIDKTEVTTLDYADCVAAGRCVRADGIVVRTEAMATLDIDPTTTPEVLADAWVSRCNAVRGEDGHPINCVSHGQATEYCHFRDKRLPTRKEWELVAGDARFPWGDEQPECTTACFDLDGDCLATAREVATCASGERSDVTSDGVHDLGGGVAEWLSDAAATDDKPPWRLIAGGSFVDPPTRLKEVRALPPTTRHVTIGFRCAVDPP
jgi:hypothetical protein